MPKKPRGRPRGPNYEKNKDRIIKSLENKGLSVVGREEQEKLAKDVTPDAYEFGLGFTKAALSAYSRQLIRIKQARGKEKRLIFHDDQVRMIDQGVIFRSPWRITYKDLRDISMTSTLIGAIHKLFRDDMQLHEEFDDELGWNLALKDKNAVPRPKDRKRILEISSIIELMGDKSVADWRKRDWFDAVLQMAGVDTLTIDAVAVVRTFNRRGEVADARYVDPATIFAIDPAKGYSGPEAGKNSEIEYVQAIDHEITEVFEPGRVVLMNRWKTSDIRFRGTGFSDLEGALVETVAALHAIKANTDPFNSGAPPKKILYTDGHLSPADKEYVEQMLASMTGNGLPVDYIPFLSGVPSMNLLDLGALDGMKFRELMEWISVMVLARHGKDQAELGLRLGQGQTMSEPSMEGGARKSRDRSHGSLMRYLAKFFQAVFEPDREDPPLVFRFTGTQHEDKMAELDRHEKMIGHFVTVDSVRAMHDMLSWGEELEKYFPDQPEMVAKLKPLGGMILNQHLAQAYQQAIMAGAGESGGEWSDEEKPENEEEERQFNWNFDEEEDNQEEKENREP